MLDETLEKHCLFEEKDEQEPRGKPRSRDLKRALELERQKKRDIVDEAMLYDQLLDMIKEEKESWLQATNEHLENSLKKYKKDNIIQRRMTKHYAKRERNAMAKFKAPKEKIEGLTHIEENKKLDILAEASLHALPHQH